MARANGGEPDAGRRLLSWARAAGFTDVTPSASTWLFATPEDRAFWGGMWAERVVDSDFAADGGRVRRGDRRADLARMATRGARGRPPGRLAGRPHGEILAPRLIRSRSAAAEPSSGGVALHRDDCGPGAGQTGEPVAG